MVMADWKRSRHLLTDDASELERQSFGRMGAFCCDHLYDCPWSHYFVQQTLYSYMLAAKYDILVRRLVLVQCHPCVCGPRWNEAPLVANFELAESMARFLLARGGGGAQFPSPADPAPQVGAAPPAGGGRREWTGANPGPPRSPGAPCPTSSGLSVVGAAPGGGGRGGAGAGSVVVGQGWQ